MVLVKRQAGAAGTNVCTPVILVVWVRSVECRGAYRFGSLRCGQGMMMMMMMKAHFEAKPKSVKLGRWGTCVPPAVAPFC